MCVFEEVWGGGGYLRGGPDRSQTSLQTQFNCSTSAVSVFILQKIWQSVCLSVCLFSPFLFLMVDFLSLSLNIPSFQASTTFTINIPWSNNFLFPILVISQKCLLEATFEKSGAKNLALSLKSWLCGLAPPTCISFALTT